MKKCIYCNKAIDDHFRICPYCGENQEYTRALPKKNQNYESPLRNEKADVTNMKRPEYYTLLVFIFNSLLITGTSYLLVKQWKILPLVFLVILGAQGGLAFLAYGIEHFGFRDKRELPDFMDWVGDYSLPGILGGVLLLFVSFVVRGPFLLMVLVLNFSMILSAGPSVLLGPAKRIYAVVVAFTYITIILLVIMAKWFGINII